MAILNTKDRKDSNDLGDSGLFYGAVGFTDSLLTSNTFPPVKATIQAKPKIESETSKKPLTSQFDTSADIEKKDNPSDYSFLALFLATRTAEERNQLDSASGMELLNVVRDFINSNDALRDMEITDADGKKTTLGKKFDGMASRYADSPNSLYRGAVENEMSGVRGIRLDNSLRYSGSSLLDSGLKVLRETSDYGGRHTGIKGASTFHKGIDLGASIGTDIRSGTDAQVAFSGKASGYGNVVILNHGSGVLTLYGHLSRDDVQTGQHIRAGQKFADSGNTGTSGGAHIHFETIVYNTRNGKWTTVDPEMVLKGEADLSTPQGRAHAIDLTESRHGRNENALVSRMAEGVVADPTRGSPVQVASHHHPAPTIT